LPVINCTELSIGITIDLPNLYPVSYHPSLFYDTHDILPSLNISAIVVRRIIWSNKFTPVVNYLLTSPIFKFWDDSPTNYFVFIYESL
jgi:hypothetical protein